MVKTVERINLMFSSKQTCSTSKDKIALVCRFCSVCYISRGKGLLFFVETTKFKEYKSSYLDRCWETTRVFRGCHYQRINVGLSQILKIQFFRKFHNSRSRTDVECTRGSLTLCFQRVAYLSIGERLGFHRYYAEKFQHVTLARTSRGLDSSGISKAMV